MKKITLIIMIISAFYLGINCVSASENEVYFTNMKGVELTEAEYNNLLKGFSHDTINTMDAEMINDIKDAENFITTEETKYIKTTEFLRNGKVVDYIEEEITFDEYNNSESTTEPIYTPYAADTKTTSYRTITLSVTAPSSASTKYVTLTNRWNKMPAMKSYDVMAISPGVAAGSFNFNGHRSAYQKYDDNVISYDVNGDKWNIVDSDFIWKKGIGISQNLVDAASRYIENSMTIVLLCGADPFPVKAAYAHAIVDTPLATSKKYTLGPNGIGGLIEFDSSVRNNYENSDGLKATWTFGV